MVQDPDSVHDTVPCDDNVVATTGTVTAVIEVTATVWLAKLAVSVGTIVTSGIG